jgi:photosystem II stability/assembly factor-like uncharacterized protein
MGTVYLAADDGLLVVDGDRAERRLEGGTAYCVAVDLAAPERVYCGTEDDGLWRSEDAGRSWRPAGPGIAHPAVMSVAVGADGRVWAGTEPSALSCSEDGGASWRERPALQEVPSKPTWSFPPRPWTHHVRWIAPDPADPRRIFVGIELGGVMRSLDDGRTWDDRKPGSQPDSHTLATHRLAPGRVYEAAGGGYAESRDGGATWRGEDAGLRWRYCWGMAVDSTDPDLVVMSVSPGPFQAHGREGAEATVYRRHGDGPWREVADGLPPTRGTRAWVLAADPTAGGSFYAAPHGGELYRSRDGGGSWERQPVAWPGGAAPDDVNGLAVAPS